MPNIERKNKRISYRSLYLVFLAVLLSSCSLRPPAQPASVASPPTRAAETENIPASITEQPVADPPEQSRVQNFPDPTNYTWELFASDFDQPVFLAHAGDNSGRLFLVEKPGQIWIMKNGERFAEPFLDIRSMVGSKQSERGLLSLAFHPDYSNNGYFFIYYTNLDGDTITARYQVSENPNLANPNTQQIIFQTTQPYANHNGGHLAFGPDGYLYISTGDGGAGGDPLGSGQDRLSFLGKILRLDINGQLPYEIPADNPLIAFSSARGENWAYGLRNPWRFSFDRASGDLFIGDVGQNNWEEIDLLPAGTPGGNLGWNLFEGNHAFEGDDADREGLIFPILEYQHTGGHCSVTGGYVYRGEQLPEWNGVYFFGDYCSGVVWGALPDAEGLWHAEQLFDLPVNLASFAEDQAGEIYLLDLNGNIYKLDSK